MRRTLELTALTGLSLAALALAGFGCGTGRFVQRGINCYNAGNYPCAMSAFQEIEYNNYELNPKGRVRYLTYRGLTHFRMGQTDLARRFLTEANVVYRSGDPTWLPPDAVQQLQQALAQLGGAAPPPGPAEPPPTPAEPTTIQ